MKKDLLSHVLVRVRQDGNFVIIYTYQRGVGAKWRFYIDRKVLREWLNGDRTRPFYDMDGDSVLAIHANGNSLCFRMFWLCRSFSKLYGNEQTFSIPLEKMLNAVYSGNAVRYLYVPKPYNTQIVLCIDHEKMQNIIRDPLKKRAFSKAMRDCFHWKDEVVFLYHDGGADFFFRTAGEHPLRGGLILHKTTIETLKGQLPMIGYSVHT